MHVCASHIAARACGTSTKNMMYDKHGSSLCVLCMLTYSSGSACVWRVHTRHVFRRNMLVYACAYTAGSHDNCVPPTYSVWCMTHGGTCVWHTVYMHTVLDIHVYHIRDRGVWCTINCTCGQHAIQIFFSNKWKTLV
jgi:hypothetical protein